MTTRDPALPAAGPTVCAGCGAPMTCGRDDPAGCWCARQPPLPAAALVGGQGCLCEPCLSARAAAISTALSRP